MKKEDLGILLLHTPPPRVDVPENIDYMRIRSTILNSLPKDVVCDVQVKTNTFIPILIPTAVAACISVVLSLQFFINSPLVSTTLNTIFDLSQIYHYYGAS